MDTPLHLPTDANAKSQDRALTRLLTLIAVMLLLLVGLSIYSLVTQQRTLERIDISLENAEAWAVTLERIAASAEAAEARAAAKDQKLKAIGSLAATQDRLITDLLESYQTDAYDNPSLDRITEQQLIAAEYQLTALQLIALQNRELIQLLAVTP